MSRQNSPQVGRPKVSSPIQTILKFSQSASVFVESLSPSAPKYQAVQDDDSHFQEIPVDEPRAVPEPPPQIRANDINPDQLQHQTIPIQPQPAVNLQPNQVFYVTPQPELAIAAVPQVPTNHTVKAKYILGHGWVPFFSSLIWLACILSLLIIWLAQGTPVYPWSGNTIAYISDVGADNKGLFISLATVAAILFITTLALDRALRKHSRLPGFWRRRENVFSVLSITFGTIGALALILLTIFDDANYDNAHWAFTAIFIISVFINAIFNALEIGLLSRHYPLARRLRSSAKVKIGTISVGLALAITMASLMAACSGDDCNTYDSTAAVFEWLVATTFVVYLATFIWDLRILDDPVINPSAIPTNNNLQQQYGNHDVELGEVKRNPVVPPLAA
eukprot:TRINITY_DN993_c0_g1_i1.p1 TRINITY_DN993_c0_g1~~TRINITY_DN993_c0_g1_i1.p1  ORF type:complete len:392 (-),score=87.74 TRINITY_DN993_c0_g1_i1:36-1211(-)